MSKLPAFPTRTPFFHKGSEVGSQGPQSGISAPHVRWLTQLPTLVNQPVQPNPPLSKIEIGSPGEIRFSDSHVYICIGKNTWKRAPLADF